MLALSAGRQLFNSRRAHYPLAPARHRQAMARIARRPGNIVGNETGDGGSDDRRRWPLAPSGKSSSIPVVRQRRAAADITVPFDYVGAAPAPDVGCGPPAAGWPIAVRRRPIAPAPR